MTFPTVSLGDAVSFKGGGTPDRENTAYWGGSIPWATVKDLNDGFVLRKTQESITSGGLANSASNLIPAGTVIIPTRMALGKAVITEVDVAINQDLKAAVPTINIDPRYLLWFFAWSAPTIVSKGKGATVKGITLDQLRRMEIPVPPLVEQRRIAAILDVADEIRVKRRGVISKLDELLQSAFLDMFGNVATNPKRWPMKRLADLGDLDRGVSRHRPRGAPELLGGNHPLIQTGDVARSGGYIRKFSSTYSETGLKQSKKWPAGTLCITIAANIADTGILTFDACFPDSVVGFTPNSGSNVEYVQGMLSFLKKILEERAPQVAQKNINLAILRELPVPAPPLALQNKWAALAIEVERVKQRLAVAEQSGERLFAALLRNAFAGML
ncbi:restriction endonuclease subunit S [Bacillus sp. NP157]|nr:restriction endonuclease subunit S [Bacillus sp. NP157]